jgi:hypothetical protein
MDEDSTPDGSQTMTHPRHAGGGLFGVCGAGLNASLRKSSSGTAGHHRTSSCSLQPAPAARSTWCSVPQFTGPSQKPFRPVKLRTVGPLARCAAAASFLWLVRSGLGSALVVRSHKPFALSFAHLGLARSRTSPIAVASLLGHRRWLRASSARRCLCFALPIVPTFRAAPNSKPSLPRSLHAATVAARVATKPQLHRQLKRAGCEGAWRPNSCRYNSRIHGVDHAPRDPQQ